MRVANGAEEGAMHRPPFRYEWNLNSIILLAGFAGVLVAWGVTWGVTTSKIDANDAATKVEIKRIDDRTVQLTAADATRWKDHLDKENDNWKDHEQLHRDRAADNAAMLSQMKADNAAAIANLQARVNANEAAIVKFSNFEWRLSKVEDSQQSQAKALDDIRTYIGDLATDQKIMREILQRLDPESRSTPQIRNPPLRRP